RVQVLKFLFRTKEFQEVDFDIVAVNVAIEIEQINFENALGLSTTDSWPNAKIDYATIQFAVDPRFRGINAVRRELFAVRAQVCRREPNLFSKVVTVRHGSKNCVFAAEHFCSFREVAFFDRLSDRCAANDRFVYFDRWNPNDVEI